MEKIRASLYMTLNVTCPECEEYIDLIADEDLNDEGWVLRQACPGKGAWSDSHDKFECSIMCPECSHNIQIKGIDW